MDGSFYHHCMAQKNSELFSSLKNGLIFDQFQSMYPSALFGVDREDCKFENQTSTFYGFIFSGTLDLKSEDKSFPALSAGMYFACPAQVQLSGPGQAMVIERSGYRGLFTVGGPVEDSGRLCYIDNASSTILVHPSRVGDPVLNLLTFPPGVIQTPHIHPTVRLGLAYEGSGECVIGKNQKFDLKPGTVFVLPQQLPHSFNSFEKGLKVIAFHPDSDVGPTDQSHPMLSRTYLMK